MKNRKGNTNETGTKENEMQFTAEHPTSSYGLPVLVDDEGHVYGKGCAVTEISNPADPRPAVILQVGKPAAPDGEGVFAGPIAADPAAILVRVWGHHRNYECWAGPESLAPPTAERVQQ